MGLIYIGLDEKIKLNKLSPACPLKLSRAESGQYLDGRPPGKTRFLLDELLVRPEWDLINYNVKKQLSI